MSAGSRFVRGYAAFLALMLIVCIGALAYLPACDPVAPMPDMAGDLGALPEPDLSDPAGPACVPCAYQPGDCGGIASLCALQSNGMTCCVSVRPLACGTVSR